METNASAVSTVPSNKGKSGWLINRDFRFLVVGQGISQFGDFVFAFTLGVWIVAKVAVGQSWAPLAFGATLVASYLPSFVIGPWAGVFVDRWQHRHTMMTMDALRACLIALMILFTGVIPLPWQFSPLAIISVVCIINFLESTCAQFFNPATNGLIGQIVPQKQQPQAEGLSLAINYIAKLIGPILGPVLYFAVGIFWGLFIDVISFLISVLTIWAIRAAYIERPAPEQQRFWRDFSQGLSFAFKDRVVRVLILSIFIVTLGVGAVDALFIFFMQRNLHTDLSLSGLLISVLGLGSILGALLLGKFANTIGLIRLLYGCLLAMGITLVIFSRMTSFPLAVLVGFLTGIAIAGVNVAVGPLLLRQTPPEMIGRVSATLGTFSTSGLMLSVLLASYLTSVVLVSLHVQAFGMLFGPIDTVYLGGGLLCVLAGLYAFIALRGVTLKAVVEVVQEQTDI